MTEDGVMLELCEDLKCFDFGQGRYIDVDQAYLLKVELDKENCVSLCQTDIL